MSPTDTEVREISAGETYNNSHSDKSTEINGMGKEVRSNGGTEKKNSTCKSNVTENEDYSVRRENNTYAQINNIDGEGVGANEGTKKKTVHARAVKKKMNGEKKDIRVIKQIMKVMFFC